MCQSTTMKIFDILPDGFKLNNLGSSKKKRADFFEAIKLSITRDNYEIVYQACIKCYVNPKFKILFAKNYKTYVKQKFGSVNLALIENSLKALPKPKPKKRRVRLFPKNIPLIKRGATTSDIYTGTGKNTKAIYCLSRE